MSLYPLRFEPIYMEKVWGGRSLEKLGKRLPGGPDTLIGESWELADLGATAASGGGGGAARSIIANGPHAGTSLHDLIASAGDALMGRLPTTASGDFPLLVKLLDAGENLSVQVHPSPAYAAAHPEAHLKSEAWYVLDAAPGACIYKGVHAGVTHEAFRSALASGDAASVEAMLVRTPVKPGDCHYLPSGVVHALGAGVMVAEVQTPSDTTFRVFDWGRQGRELHIEPAMACIRFGPTHSEPYEKRSHVAGVFTTISRLVTCEHFQIEKVRMSEGYRQEIPYDQPAVWIVLAGRGWIDAPGHDPVDFQAGQTLLIPAEMTEAAVNLEADTVWLEVTFPQAQLDQIA